MALKKMQSHNNMTFAGQGSMANLTFAGEAAAGGAAAGGAAGMMAIRAGDQAEDGGKGAAAAPAVPQMTAQQKAKAACARTAQVGLCSA
jgi:hypothetical protein